MFLPAQAAAEQAGVQAKRFGMGEEVERSGQKAGAGLALFRPKRRVSVSVVAAVLLEAYAFLPARHRVLFGLNQLAAHTEGLETNLWEWDQTAPCEMEKL